MNHFSFFLLLVANKDLVNTKVFKNLATGLRMIAYQCLQCCLVELSKLLLFQQVIACLYNFLYSAQLECMLFDGKFFEIFDVLWRHMLLKVDKADLQHNNFLF